jgi:hypothetical protein
MSDLPRALDNRRSVMPRISRPLERAIEDAASTAEHRRGRTRTH